MQYLSTIVLILGVIAIIAGPIVIARVINSDEAKGELISPLANHHSVRPDALTGAHSS